MSRREPEHVAHRLAALTLGGLAKCGRGLRLGPRVSEVLRAVGRRPEMARAHRGQERSAVARIEHRVVHDLAEEMRAFDRPRAPIGARREDEETLAGSDQDKDSRHAHSPRRAVRYGSFLMIDLSDPSRPRFSSAGGGSGVFWTT